MIKTKKAQSLSTNTVILMILGVIVLAVLLFFLRQSAGDSYNAIFNCEPSRGICQNKGTCEPYLKVNGKCFDAKGKTTDTKECCAITENKKQ